MKSILAILLAVLLLFGCAQQEERPLNLSSWNMKTLADMKTPIHCIVTYSSQNFSANYDMYFLGENFLAIGEFTVFGGTYEVAQVVKTVNGTKMDYFRLKPEGTETQNCNWTAYEQEENGSHPASVETEGAPDSYECFYAAFGQEKFVTPGEVCPGPSLGG